MPDVSQSLTSKRSRFAVMLLLAAVAGVLLLGIRASAAHAENKCTSGELCAWTGTFYTGSEYFLACPSIPGTETFIPEANSAKNRCGVSVELGWAEGGSTNWKVCMNPGGERPEPGRFNRYRFHSGAC